MHISHFRGCTDLVYGRFRAGSVPAQAGWLRLYGARGLLAESQSRLTERHKNMEKSHVLKKASKNKNVFWTFRDLKPQSSRAHEAASACAHCAKELPDLCMLFCKRDRDSEPPPITRCVWHESNMQTFAALARLHHKCRHRFGLT